MGVRVAWIVANTPPSVQIPKLKENGARHAEISPPKGRGVPPRPERPEIRCLPGDSRVFEARDS